MSAARFLFVSTFIFLTFVWISSACRCAFRPREEIYNSSSFVSHVRILNRSEYILDEQWEHVVYEVEHLRIYKPFGQSSLSDHVWTSASPASCGIPYLRVGHEYLFSGSEHYKNDSHLSISLCGQISEVVNGTIENGEVKLTDDDVLNLLNGV